MHDHASSSLADGISYRNDEWNLTLTVPQGSSHDVLDRDGMYFGYAADHPNEGSAIQIYRPSPSFCTPAHLGNPEIHAISGVGEKTLWARMLLLSAYDRDQDTYCHPNPPDCSYEELFYGRCKTKSATYAFCSEKAGKTVAICINQVTDDPDLVKQIFETFRWTK